MSDKLEAVLVDAIQKTQSGIGEAVDFAFTQAPEVIQQLLLWHAVRSGILFSLTVFALLVYVVFLYKIDWKKPEPGKSNNVWRWQRYSEKHEINADYSFGIPIISCIFLPMVFVFMATNMDWLKIWIAPKLYLVEYAAQLVK